jgi:hypothetical protein
MTEPGDASRGRIVDASSTLATSTTYGTDHRRGPREPVGPAGRLLLVPADRYVPESLSSACELSDRIACEGTSMKASRAEAAARRSEQKEELYRMLAEAAVARSTVTYSDVALRVFGGRVPARSRLIMDLLSEVDAEVEAARGVIIASLVVRADSGMPGAGYFTFIARQFGRDVSDPRAAWLAEAERVWNAFARGQEHDGE